MQIVFILCYLNSLFIQFTFLWIKDKKKSRLLLIVVCKLIFVVLATSLRDNPQAIVSFYAINRGFFQLQTFQNRSQLKVLAILNKLAVSFKLGSSQQNGEFLRGVIRKQKHFYLFGVPCFDSKWLINQSFFINFFTHLPLKFQINLP